MHVGFAINVIQTAKYRKYTHIELTSCSSWTHKNTFGVIIVVQGECDPKGSAKDHIRPLKAYDSGRIAFQNDVSYKVS